MLQASLPLFFLPEKIIHFLLSRTSPVSPSSCPHAARPRFPFNGDPAEGCSSLCARMLINATKFFLLSAGAPSLFFLAVRALLSCSRAVPPPAQGGTFPLICEDSPCPHPFPGPAKLTLRPFLFFSSAAHLANRVSVLRAPMFCPSFAPPR